MRLDDVIDKMEFPKNVELAKKTFGKYVIRLCATEFRGHLDDDWMVVVEDINPKSSIARIHLSSLLVASAMGQGNTFYANVRGYRPITLSEREVSRIADWATKVRKMYYQ